jgi:hypothetical protein
MILTAAELNIIKPALALIEHLQHTNVVLHTTAANGRRACIDLSAAGIVIKAEYPDSAPALEFYRFPQGLALAYGVSLKKLLTLPDRD